VPHSLEELLMIVLQLEGQRSLEIPLMIAAAISPRPKISLPRIWQDGGSLLASKCSLRLSERALSDQNAKQMT
jgi:hypothetical protein